MWQRLRMAALAVSMVVALSTFTWAQDYDHDDYYRGRNGTQARQYGYQSGYRDGEKKGRHEGRENLGAMLQGPIQQPDVTKAETLEQPVKDTVDPPKEACRSL